MTEWYDPGHSISALLVVNLTLRDRLHHRQRRLACHGILESEAYRNQAAWGAKRGSEAYRNQAAWGAKRGGYDSVNDHSTRSIHRIISRQ